MRCASGCTCRPAVATETLIEAVPAREAWIEAYMTAEVRIEAIGERGRHTSSTSRCRRAWPWGD
ncbi:hypothetical protein E2562_018044 [Oryza meyeriana var. granulata]|uniref:Uncharacterized protein n=1 Tax=Oryza meyeriana var. granulata TaxID=110450 RepID=A0A6G1C716_9ORYZ|nr:hypothetical protein E2562_018044 [Oryza meyeriana var. granulata]